MVDAAGNVMADDIAPRVDTEGKGGCGTREIDAGEGKREGDCGHRDQP